MTNTPKQDHEDGPPVVKSDPVACRVRWHDNCTVETLADGTVRHTANGAEYYSATTPNRGSW